MIEPGSRGRSRQAIFAIVTDLIGSVSLAVATFAIAPIILHQTSQSLYGFWVITLSILGYLALTDFGLGVSLTRLVAGLTNSQDSVSLNRLVSSAFFSFCVAGVVFFCIGIGVSPYIPGWFSIPQPEAIRVIAAYQVAVLAGAVALPLSIYSAVLVGYQRMAVANNIRSVVSLIAIGVSLILLAAGFGIMSLALSSLFTVIVGGGITWLYVRRLCPQLTIAHHLINRGDLSRLLVFGGYFQIGRLTNAIALNSDNLVIAAAMGSAMVVPYSFTSKIALFFSVNISSKMSTAVFPALSQMFAQNKIHELQYVFIQLTRFSTRLAIVMGVFFAITNHTVVSLWVGEHNFGGPMLNAVFVFWILQDTIYRGTGVLTHASGELRNWAIVSIAEAVLNLGASLLLVGQFGLVGVALGTSIGKMLTTSWYIPYWICRRLQLSIKDYLWVGILSSALRSLPGAILTVGIAFLSPASRDWGWVILVGFVSILTNFILFEGVELAKPSSLSLPDRWRQLVRLSTAGV